MLNVLKVVRYWYLQLLMFELKIHVFFIPGVSKQTQELYGLVNYSELRKKIGGCMWILVFFKIDSNI